MSFSTRLFILVCVFIAVSSCSKKKDDKLQSFQAFSANMRIEPTADCQTDNCLSLKQEFKYVVDVGQKIYCYRNEKQVQYQINFDAKAAELEAQITDQTTETQYFMILMKWAAVFRDGHVNPMMRADTSQLDFYSTQVRFEMLAPGTDHERLIVAQVGSDIKSLRVGTVVDKIQGRDWRTYVDKADQLAMGSTAAMRHRQVANLIMRVLLAEEGPKPILIEGTYNDQPVSETVARQLSLYDGAVDNSPDSTGLELIKASILPNNIGYLRIDGFSGSKMQDLLNQAMDRLKNTDGLLIDVRKNGGGDQSGNVILSRLASKTIIRYSHRSIHSDYLLALRPEIEFTFDYVSGLFTELSPRRVRAVDSETRYSKPVAVLTSPNCFSACDTFVSALSQNKLAVVLGERTGGGTGSPQVIELPISGHSFRYSVFQGFTAVTNELLEGQGTLPDVTLEPTLQERMEGKDRQLEKAVNWLGTYIQSNTPNAAPVLPPFVGPGLAQAGQNNSAIQLPAQFLESAPRADLSRPYEAELDREIKSSGE